ncbi:hypothetical protein INT45_001342, partial [Circinella minor]
FDPNINRLHPQTRAELSVGRNSIIQLFCALDTGKCLISDYLARALLPGAPILVSAGFYLGQVDLTPFYNRLQINTIPLHQCTTRTYRLSRQHSTITMVAEDPSYPSLAKSKWKVFWKARILPAARTIWWRALHNKISCRSILHHILPTHFDTDLCPLGDLQTDSVSHFLFSCESKWIVWQQVLQDCTLTTVSQEMIADAIFNLHIPDWNSFPSPLSPIQLLSGTLLGVWRAHWLLVFSSVPFTPSNVIDSTHKLINFRLEEAHFDRKPP